MTGRRRWHRPSGTLPTPAPEGEPCDYTQDCERGLVCSMLGASESTCQRPPVLGEPCDNTCAEGVCDANVCVPVRRLGEPCTEFSQACQSDLACKDGLCAASAFLDLFNWIGTGAVRNSRRVYLFKTLLTRRYEDCGVFYHATAR